MNCAQHHAVSALPSLEIEIARCKTAERLRLHQAAGIAQRPIDHYRRPVERPFTAEERDRVTILFGGFTWKHERFIEASEEMRRWSRSSAVKGRSTGRR